MSVRLREDIYGGPQDDLLRFWLSIDIPRTLAEKSLMTPHLAPSGSFILRRSKSSPGNYAVTVVQGKKIKSYEITDLGMGQVGLSTGQAFESIETMLDFFFTHPFPDEGNGHVALTRMHPRIHGVQMPRFMGAPAPQAQASNASDSMYETIDSHERHQVSQGALPDRLQAGSEDTGYRPLGPTYDDPDAAYGDTSSARAGRSKLPPDTRRVVQQQAASAAISTKVGGSLLRVPSHKRHATPGYEGELTKPVAAYDDMPAPGILPAQGMYGDTGAPPPTTTAASQATYGEPTYGDAGEDAAFENVYGDEHLPPPQDASGAVYGDTGLYGDGTEAAHAGDDLYGDSHLPPLATTTAPTGGEGLYGDVDHAAPPPRPTAAKPAVGGSARGRTNSSGVTYDMPRQKAAQVTYSVPQDVRAKPPQATPEGLYGEPEDEYNTEAGDAITFSMADLGLGQAVAEEGLYGEPQEGRYGQPASEEALYGDTGPEPYDKPRATGAKR